MINTPAYIISESQLEKNLTILKDIKDRTGCKIILAMKAFSAFSTFPLISRYLDGCTASSLHEVKLGHEEFGKEVHVYSPGFKENEIDEIARSVDHIVFNSYSQLHKYKDRVKQINPTIEIALRLNPEHSEVTHSLYNPCSPFSRFGITKAEFKPEELEGIDGFLFHTLCGKNSDALERTIATIEKNFGEHLHKVKWIDLGGGHVITQDVYDREKLVTLITNFQKKYNVQVILEPGEAVVIKAGRLVTTVLDIMHNEKDIVILDSSATAHMPDVLEMPYRPEVQNANKPDVFEHNYRLTGVTCLSGDVIGDYSFQKPLQVGDTVTFLDMAQYTMVKNTTFNGLQLPSIAIERKDGTIDVIKEFGYEDFKSRLS